MRKGKKKGLKRIVFLVFPKGEFFLGVLGVLGVLGFLGFLVLLGFLKKKRNAFLSALRYSLYDTFSVFGCFSKQAGQTPL